jgi:hypothetical protein
MFAMTSWRPDPHWDPLPGGLGPVTVGVWRDGDTVIKRLARPAEDDPAELSEPGHFAWWRRPAEVAVSGCVVSTPGLRGPATRAIEDDDGITLTSPYVEGAGNSGLFLARALGRFAGAELPDAEWLSRDQMRQRIRRVEHRGGWPTLARTTVADVADFLWRRRHVHLNRLDELPQVPQHGDPTPANLPGRLGDDAVGIDWAGLGFGAVGADLGYLSLSAREDFEHLVSSYLVGLPTGLATREQVEAGARVIAVYTSLSRAEWALARVADGAGALAGKFRHPAVAPYLRALQRQFPQIEALLD